MTYLRRPSTYVIAAITLGIYMFVWPMLSGAFRAKPAGS